MDKYSEHLAIHVLNEQQLVSYRSLSRALKIHGNLAKQMLFEFHRKQNSKKPGSIHATYLISGTKKSQAFSNGVSDHDDEDVDMTSSPMLPGSSMPNQEKEEEHQPIVTQSIALVREEHLARARAEFDSISSIHIYSLEADGLSDFQTLSECNRQIAVKHAEEDPLNAWKQYGTIQNPFVQRRERQNGAQNRAFITSDTKSKVQSVPPKQVEPERAQPKQVSTAISNNANPEPEKQGPGKASLKRESSSLFKAFAKTKSAPKKSESQDSASQPEPTKDAAMIDFSDEDEIGVDDASVAALGEEGVEPAGKSKREREAELQAMMEQEDEVMDDVDDTHNEDGDAEETIDTAPSVPEEPKETVTVENGRRRGRRRVMKKKTVKDEDGYLVTREEAAWESFSEEEPAPKKAKVLPAASTKPTTGKKASGRPGQGNITSFFSKK